MHRRANANFADLIHPAKAHLATTPTPVTLLTELNRESPVSISVKREDLTGSFLAGGEVRALEYVLHEARVKMGATALITCGRANSPLIRTISIAARQLGFGEVHLFLLGQAPENQTGGSGNLFLNYMAGSKIYYINEAQYEHRERLMNRLARVLGAKGDSVFVIPDYVCQPSGLWGYISMIKEMLDPHNKFPYTHVFVPSNTGMALAGILIARAMLKLHFPVIAFAVSGTSVTETEARIDRAITAFNTQYGCNYSAGIYTLSDNYAGPGPGQTYPEAIYWSQRLARLEGIFLDPVTTGKAFYGLMDQAIRKAFSPTDKVVFINTGNPFTLLENHSLFSFPQSTPELDPSVLSTEQFEERVTREEAVEDEKASRRGSSWELDIEEDYEERERISLVKH